MVTTFADWCPSGWRQNEKGKTGNIDPNAKCTFGWMTAMDFHGCFLKETKGNQLINITIQRCTVYVYNYKMECVF